MSLKTDLQKIAQNAIKVVKGMKLHVVIYYSSIGAITYTPATSGHTEANALTTITGTDIAAVASNSITSVTTDLSGIAYDGRCIKISGFTESANNDYFTPVSVAEHIITFQENVIVSEAIGNTVSIDGYFYKLNGSKGKYTEIETDGEKITAKDSRLIFAALDIDVTPKTQDILYLKEDGVVTEYEIIDFTIDGAGAMYDMQIRKE